MQGRERGILRSATARFRDADDNNNTGLGLLVDSCRQANKSGRTHALKRRCVSVSVVLTSQNVSGRSGGVGGRTYLMGSTCSRRAGVDSLS